MDSRQAVRFGLIALSLFVVTACEEAGPYGPVDLVVHPAGTHLYVAGGTLTESVWIVDAGTHQVVGTIPIPNPRALAMSPSGVLYVGNVRDNGIAVIDTSSHTVIGSLPTETPINDFGVNGTGTRLFLATPESVLVYETSGHTLIGAVQNGAFDVVSVPWFDEVYVLDDIFPVVIAILRDGDKIGEIQLPIEWGVTLAAHPSGTQLYVADSSNARILIVDPVRRAVASVIPLPRAVGALAVHPAGRVLYGISSEATIDAIALPAGRILASRSVERIPRDIAVHPSGTHLYITDPGAQAVHVLDASTLNIVATVQP